MKNSSFTLHVLTFCCLALACNACSGSAGSYAENEIVLCPGSAVAVESGAERIRVSAPEILERKIETSSAHWTIKVFPRPERWNGSFGVYNPSAGNSSIHIVADEGFQYFASLNELQDWVQARRRRMHLVYNSSGLAVGWNVATRPTTTVEGPPSVLQLEVWQLFVGGGSIPSNIPGAEDGQFKEIVRAPTACSHPKSFSPSAPSAIGGRSYTGRALDAMKARGISAEQVERLIREGRRGNVGESVHFSDYSPNSPVAGPHLVVLNPQGEVVQVE